MDNYNYSQDNYRGGYGYSNNGETPLSVGEWIITIIVLAIPCVNIIMLFVWGFGSGNQSRANYCKANLAIALILFVLYLVLIILGSGSLAGIYNAYR